MSIFVDKKINPARSFYQIIVQQNLLGRLMGAMFVHSTQKQERMPQ
jgi:hypothetical protein